MKAAARVLGGGEQGVRPSQCAGERIPQTLLSGSRNAGPQGLARDPGLRNLLKLGPIKSIRGSGLLGGAPVRGCRDPQSPPFPPLSQER